MSAPRLRAYRVHVHIIETRGFSIVAASEDDAYDQARQTVKDRLADLESVSTTVWGPYLKLIDNVETGA